MPAEVESECVVLVEERQAFFPELSIDTAEAWLNGRPLHRRAGALLHIWCDGYNWVGDRRGPDDIAEFARQSEKSGGWQGSGHADCEDDKAC